LGTTVWSILGATFALVNADGDSVPSEMGIEITLPFPLDLQGGGGPLCGGESHIPFAFGLGSLVDPWPGTVNNQSHQFFKLFGKLL
jgi:hypothetical protein